MGVVKSLEVEAYTVKTVVDFHVMPAGLGAYPIVLGRPWLRVVSAIEDWRHGTITLCRKTGGKRLFDMSSRKPLDEEYEDGGDSSDEESSTVSEVDSDSTTSSDEDVDVAFLLVDKELDKTSMVAAIDEVQDDYVGPYERIEELMQPKVELHEKQELMAKMVSKDLLAMEKEKYS